ncbi:hypothetical protein [Nocardioides sp. TF02-7]|uniref:hypothetical protein n=1 Tax=Nocardioides sp. TF02-7 TaxID=2917724 RepID=UPI001F06C659|nr:hypothetical protein [Nocardioides sp. TF02-7]UMG91472.1 hypothetical protein MF408_15230 [Nocardioides sp. TF02-7]
MNSEIFRFTPSAFASAVVRSASRTVASTLPVRSPLRGDEQLGEDRRDVVGPELHARLGRHDPRLALHDAERRVDGLPAGGGALDEAGQPLLVDAGHELAVLGHHRQRAGVLLRPEPDLGLAEDEGNRRRHRRVGEAVDRLLDVGLVDVGAGLLDREPGGLLLAEERLGDRGAGGVGVDGLAGHGLDDVDAVGGDQHPAVLRWRAETLGQLGEPGVQQLLVDVHDGVDVVAAGEVVPQPRRAQVLLGAGGVDRRGVVDAETDLLRAHLRRPVLDLHLDRACGAVAERLLELGDRVVAAEAADVDTGDRRAARHLVAGHRVGGVVGTAEQRDQQHDDQHDDPAAGSLALGGLALAGLLIPERHACILGRRARRTGNPDPLRGHGRVPARAEDPRQQHRHARAEQQPAGHVAGDQVVPLRPLRGEDQHRGDPPEGERQPQPPAAGERDQPGSGRAEPHGHPPPPGVQQQRRQSDRRSQEQEDDGDRDPGGARTRH